jgi:hypothetical protein
MVIEIMGISSSITTMKPNKIRALFVTKDPELFSIAKRKREQH